MGDISVGTIKVDLEANLANWTRGLTKAASSLRLFGSTTKSLTASIKGNLLRGFGQIGTGIRGIFNNLTSAAKLAGIGIAAAFGMAIKAGADFEDTINRAAAITSEAGPSMARDIKALSNTALELGKNTLYSATQVGEGMQTMARAGFKVAQIQAAMPGITDLAIVANENLNQVTQEAIGIMYQFGLQAKDSSMIADVMTAATNKTKMSIGDLAAGFQYLGPIAHSLGLSLSETAAVLGLVANAGIPASMGGRSLRRAFIRLLHPSTEAKKILDKYGISVTTASGKLRKFSNIIGDLQKAHLKPLELTELFGPIGMTAMLPLINQGREKIDSLTRAIENANGITHKTANTFRNTFIGRMKDLGASLINFGIHLKNAFGGRLKDTVFAIRNWINSIDETLQKNDKLKKIVDALVDALSPLAHVIKSMKSKFINWLEHVDPKKLEKKLKNLSKSIITHFKAIWPEIKKTFSFLKDIFTRLLDSFAKLADWFTKLPNWAKDLAVLATAISLLGGGQIIAGIISLAGAFSKLAMAISAVKTAAGISLFSKLLGLAGGAAAGAGALIGGAAAGAAFGPPLWSEGHLAKAMKKNPALGLKYMESGTFGGSLAKTLNPDIYKVLKWNAEQQKINAKASKKYATVIEALQLGLTPVLDSSTKAIERNTEIAKNNQRKLEEFMQKFKRIEAAQREAAVAKNNE